MPDEAPEATLDTPDAELESGTPTETPAETNWEERYQNLQPAYTQATQEAAQYRQFVESLTNPETQAQALDALGLQIQEEEEEYEDDSEYIDPTEQRLEQVEAFLVQQQEAAESEVWIEAEQQFEAERIAELQSQEGREFSDTELQLLLSTAEANRKPDGEPDFELALAALGDAYETRQKRYAESKKAQAPQIGTAGEDKFNVRNSEERLQATAAMIEAISQADSE